MSTADIRSRVKMSDAELVEHFSRLGFNVRIEELTFTTETVEDFLEARDTVWHRPGDVERYEAKGILIVRQAQPKSSQPFRDIVVVSLWHARVVLGLMPGAVFDPHLPRYAEDMA